MDHFQLPTSMPTNVDLPFPSVAFSSSSSSLVTSPSSVPVITTTTRTSLIPP